MQLDGMATLRERRKNFRVEWNSAATISDSIGRFIQQCVVNNFSSGGAKISGVEPDAIPDEFILRISPHSRPHRCHVVWRSKGGLGVEFTDDPRGTGEPKAAGEPAPSRRRKSVA
jgi:hypothetical protein